MDDYHNSSHRVCLPNAFTNILQAPTRPDRGTCPKSPGPDLVWNYPKFGVWLMLLFFSVLNDFSTNPIGRTLRHQRCSGARRGEDNAGQALPHNGGYLQPTDYGRYILLPGDLDGGTAPCRFRRNSWGSRAERPRTVSFPCRLDEPIEFNLRGVQ